MKRIRSVVLRVVFCLLALGSAPHRLQAQSTPAPNIRMKWQDFISGPDGAQRLASLQNAVAKMKSLNNSPENSADFRRSWKYWANIHGYLGPNSKFGTLDAQKKRLTQLQMTQFLPFLIGTTGKPGLTDQTPPDAIASAIWATCQHSPNNQQLDFFGWHRMYLYYFERVLRWAANDQKITLPYWDYTDPNQTALPDAFQDINSPLYDWRRSEALNEGLATLNPQITDIDGPLTTDTAFVQYEGDIERGVHGNVHCSVGQTCPIAVMGLVGVAANDPIFYEHHANIDRMWSCWQHAHPNEAPGDWQNDSFSFVDETGAMVTRQVKDFLDTKALGYVYDNDSNCTRAMPPAPIVVAQAAVSDQATPILAASDKPLPLNATATSVKVSLPARQAGLTTTTVPRQPILVLHGVSARSDPGALLSVFVSSPDRPTTREYVGTINWFGVFDHMEGMGHEGPVSRAFQYNIGRQLQALGLVDAREVTVTFEATSGLAPEKSRKRPR